MDYVFLFVRKVGQGVDVSRRDVMKNILFLSTRYKKERAPSSKRAPEILESIAEVVRSEAVAVDAELIEGLTFLIADGKPEILTSDGARDIADYDLVYVKFWGSQHSLLDAIAIYLQSKNVKFICSEVGQWRLENKIAEGMLIAAKRMNYPDSVFSINQGKMIEIAQKWGYPFILKSIDGQKGDDNYLIEDKKHLDSVLAGLDVSTWMMAQRMIPNDGDYRLLCFGSEPQLIIKRSKQDDSHLSNSSKGASVELIDAEDFPVDILEVVRELCRAANREVAGVDIMFDSKTGEYVILEINFSPQIATGAFVEQKAIKFSEYINEQLHSTKTRVAAVNDLIGVSAHMDFLPYKNLKQIPARIDTGARTSSLWASDVKIKNGVATFKLFGPGSKWYTGKVVRRKVIEQREVTSSTGHTEVRNLVAMSVRLHGKRLNAKFTLSDRSTQTYPILIGRNTLRGNFLVDSGDPGEARLYKYPEEANEFNESEAE